MATLLRPSDQTSPDWIDGISPRDPGIPYSKNPGRIIRRDELTFLLRDDLNGWDRKLEEFQIRDIEVELRRARSLAFLATRYSIQ